MSDPVYVDLDGNAFSMRDLDNEELRVLRSCMRCYQKNPDWGEYHNYWHPKVDELYSARRLSPRQIVDTAVYKIAQDLGLRLMVKQGLARPTDYRDELEDLITDKFSSRREFCKATGLSEDMLSHVLAGRKHLAINTLADALERIGYRIRIVPSMPAEPRKRRAADAKARRAS